MFTQRILKTIGKQLKNNPEYARTHKKTAGFLYFYAASIEKHKEDKWKTSQSMQQPMKTKGFLYFYAESTENQRNTHENQCIQAKKQCKQKV